MNLSQFTQTSLLRSIGEYRIAKLLNHFTDDLLQANINIPDRQEQNGQYLDSVAVIFRESSRLPQRMLQTLLTIENAATSENQDLLEATIRRQPGELTLRDCVLDRALELWFVAPEELSQFATLPSQIKTHSPPPTTATEVADITPPEATGVAPSEIQNHPAQRGTKIENDEAALLRLAALTPLEYDRVRKSEANKLRVRVEVLDAEVLKLRESEYDAKANEVKFSVIEPWPEPVKLSEVLNDAYGSFTRFVAMPTGGATATTLWGAHAHVFEAFVQSPRLNLCSAESGSGKTTTFDVLAPMVPRALRTENLKPAILFRVVEKHRPTLLLDEVDTYLAPDLELRGLLNAGHKRGGCALRYESGGVRSFSAFSPAALGGIGPLPVTLHNRSIVIPLVPALPGEVTHSFDPANAEIEIGIGRKLARWALDNFETLRNFKPVMPPAAYNRLADNWRPLFAIAQLAGDDWPRRVEEAFTILALNARKTQSISVMLLSDIRDIFAELRVERIASKQLVEELCSLVERPWTEVNRKGSINEHWLARQLRRFDIAPLTLRMGQDRAKGYELASFIQVFARYLPEDRSGTHG